MRELIRVSISKWRFRRNRRRSSRESVKAMRKNVLAKCYGRHLAQRKLAREAEGSKKRMKAGRKVQIRRKRSLPC